MTSLHQVTVDVPAVYRFAKQCIKCHYRYRWYAVWLAASL